MATHARLLDRRRSQLILGGGTTKAALAALAAYSNADGGYGSGLEPDLRTSSSQPVSALHAFEVFEDIAPDTAPEATPAVRTGWVRSHCPTAGCRSPS
jgi:hypothetical protein